MNLRVAVCAIFIVVVATLTLRTQTAAEQPRYALLVGISKYKAEGLNRIDGCENNLPLLSQTLIDSYGFKKNDVRILLNEQAGKNAILSAFKAHLVDNARKAKQSGKEPVILYYFCGHGSQYKDQDKDELDGLDETFVAYDSRTGETGDILDDELDDLKGDLRQYTTNTTLILESCHSGTGSRGDDDDRMYASEEADPDTRVYPPYKRKHPPTGDGDADTYTEIAASASTNTAKSETAQFCNCEKPYSLMTKALVEALNRANHATTYRSLVREVSAVVADRSRQDPRVEGNRDTVLFGGAAKRTKPYIEIEKVLPGGQVLIRAGSIHGLKAGSQVAIYDSSSATNSGDTDWLTNGTVKDVRNFQSIVQLPSAKDNAKVGKVALSSHVVLTSPVFGGGPVLVSLETGAARTPGDELVTRVREQLTADQLVDDQMISIVDPAKVTPASLKASRGVIRLRKDKFVVAFPDRIRSLARVPKPRKCSVENGQVTFETVPEIKPDTEVYFLDDGNTGGKPLFGRVFLPEASAAPEIARLIRNYALRTNLEGLDNSASTLPSQISLTVNRIDNVQVVENCRDGVIEKGLKSKPTAADMRAVKDGKIPVGSIFSFKVKNISGELRKKKDPFAGGEPFYVAAIYLLNNGDIDVIYPRLGSNDPLGDGMEKSFGGYIASKPAGAEQLVVIVSKKFVDFSFYSSVGARRNPQSVLERLLKQSGNKTRDAGTLIPDEPDQWGVLRVDLDIIE
jgi:hypothetical protein